MRGCQQGALALGSECSRHGHQHAPVSSPLIRTRIPPRPPVPPAFPSKSPAATQEVQAHFACCLHARCPSSSSSSITLDLDTACLHPCCSIRSRLVSRLWRDGGLGAAACHAGDGHTGTVAPALAEAGLSVMLVPAARGTGATFIYHYQAGKKRWRERGAET